MPPLRPTLPFRYLFPWYFQIFAFGCENPKEFHKKIRPRQFHCNIKSQNLTLYVRAKYAGLWCSSCQWINSLGSSKHPKQSITMKSFRRKCVVNPPRPYPGLSTFPKELQLNFTFLFRNNWILGNSSTLLHPKPKLFQERSKQF